MGITHHDFVENFSGLYKQNPQMININIDGEYLWWKGVNSENLSISNSEDRIAKTSYDYLLKLINMIRKQFGCVIYEIIIYMDGARVNNKEHRYNAATLKFDITSARKNFIQLCRQINNCKIVQLDIGEAELQMYKNRNVNIELNVFVTADTDMLSICYGHKSTISEKLLELKGEITLSQSNRNGLANTENIDLPMLLSETKTRTVTPMFDDNFNYSEKYNVVDSCVWLRIAKWKLHLIGFDFSERIHKFKVNVFRVFLGMCGNDFIKPIITNTMSLTFLSSTDRERENLNIIEDHNLFDIITGVLYTICKSNILNVIGKKDPVPFKLPSGFRGRKNLKKDSIVEHFKMYLDYIDAGFMSNVELNRKFNNSLVANHTFQAMIPENKNKKLTSRLVYTWCTMNSIFKAIKNVHDNWKDIEEEEYSMPKSTCKQRNQQQQVNDIDLFCSELDSVETLELFNGLNDYIDVFNEKEMQEDEDDEPIFKKFKFELTGL